MSFSTQNHAEPLRNYLKKSVLDPKRAKCNQNSDFLTKQCTQISIIKTWLHRWTTSTRFGNYHQPCPLCHQPNSDTLRHYYNCAPLTAAARQVLNQPHLPTTLNYFFLAHNYSNSQGNNEQHFLFNAIHIHCITKTYHHVKHNPHDDITDAYKANLKQLLQHDPGLVKTYQIV